MNVVLVLQTALAFQLRIPLCTEYLRGEWILTCISSSDAADGTIDGFDGWTNRRMNPVVQQLAVAAFSWHVRSITPTLERWNSVCYMPSSSRDR